MNFTVDWVFPVGLGVLGTLLTIYNWNFKIAPVKIKKPKSRRYEFSYILYSGRIVYELGFDTKLFFKMFPDGLNSSGFCRIMASQNQHTFIF